MRMSLENGVIQLAAGKPLAFRGARDVHLECTEGMVWLTLAGEPDDYFLAKGERLRIEHDGLALIEGNPTGAIRLACATPRRSGRHFGPIGMSIRARCCPGSYRLWSR